MDKRIEKQVTDMYELGANMWEPVTAFILAQTTKLCKNYLTPMQSLENGQEK